MAAPPERSAPASLAGTNAAVPPAPKVEARLIARVFKRCHGFLEAACAPSSVPEAFLAALVANESGANPRAARFEPLVYRHLLKVAQGDEPVYGMLHPGEILTEVEDMLHPKASEYHARFLRQPFADHSGDELAKLQDEALRELATSWGFTQIMGYHMVGRRGTTRDLLEPAFHFRVALELLAEFADEYQLDVRREFAELFRCWNTGRPYGETTDPEYVKNGLLRMEIYRALAAPPQAGTDRAEASRSAA
ncbi:MAG TPA: hypothetical protein VFM21_05945 [Terriglobia bacterium]|nr:hypothetical protein [Terriglobia bacterium]